MEKQKDVLRILWTIDPFIKETDLLISTALAIKKLTKEFKCIIEPIYFYSEYIPVDTSLNLPREWFRDLQRTGQEELNKILSRVKLIGVQRLHFISEPYLSLRDGIDRIVSLAKRSKVELIVTATHARKGLKRWALGSFAETLLLSSDVPVFFVNPLWNSKSNFKHILFPTDFSEESKETFHSLLKTARTLQCEITLFHKLDFCWPPTALASIAAPPIYIDACKLEFKNKQDIAKQWANEAAMRQVKVLVDIDRRIDEPVFQAILRKARKRPGMIAMASRSGPARATLLGSTTRKVVRASPFPVWVLHPHLKHQEMPLFSVTANDIEGDLKRIPHHKESA